MPIETIQIATNRYAPSGSEAIQMYDTGASGAITLGQLVQAVCIRSAAAYEAQSVIKMNAMTDGSVKLDAAGAWLKRIVQGTADWTAARTFLTGTMGVEASALPPDLATYDRRMQAVNALKAKMDALTQNQQEQMIDLQTMVNRRDVAFSTSSNVVRALGTSQTGNAQNF
ncbi:MAG: hypothetical protein IJV65_04930 [Kiritimatiellae bacterium]|nr:hypothetical protein [Kiritimatiellia bacterium]